MSWLTTGEVANRLGLSAERYVPRTIQKYEELAGGQVGVRKVLIDSRWRKQYVEADVEVMAQWREEHLAVTPGKAWRHKPITPKGWYGIGYRKELIRRAHRSVQLRKGVRRIR